MRLAITLVGVLAVLSYAGAASAQMKYVDKDGASHWVQSQDQIPPEYRGQDQPNLPVGSNFEQSEEENAVRGKIKADLNKMRDEKALLDAAKACDAGRAPKAMCNEIARGLGRDLLRPITEK